MDGQVRAQIFSVPESLCASLLRADQFFVFTMGTQMRIQAGLRYKQPPAAFIVTGEKCFSRPNTRVWHHPLWFGPFSSACHRAGNARGDNMTVPVLRPVFFERKSSAAPCMRAKKVFLAAMDMQVRCQMAGLDKAFAARLVRTDIGLGSRGVAQVNSKIV